MISKHNHKHSALPHNPSPLSATSFPTTKYLQMHPIHSQMPIQIVVEKNVVIWENVLQYHWQDGYMFRKGWLWRQDRVCQIFHIVDRSRSWLLDWVWGWQLFLLSIQSFTNASSVRWHIPPSEEPLQLTSSLEMHNQLGWTLTFPKFHHHGSIINNLLLFQLMITTNSSSIHTHHFIL